MDPKEEIKQRLDIVEVIQEYLPLKPAGTNAFKAVCPFHQEKTPSFHVSRAKQIWRCFGCGAGGDIFSFVMQIEGVEFPEALRLLGKKAGVEVARYTQADTNEKQQLQRLQQFAAAYYHKVLMDASYAAATRAYCEKRGISAELLQQFQIGYAPEEWDAFAKIARQKGFSEKDLLAGGLALARKSGGGVIDRFRGRLMIPLRDVHGNVIGFTGRILQSPAPTDSPKYMNSPETLLYKKGEILYGLDLAKQAVRQEDAVIIVEGNLDVVASHKGGVKNVVASSGTALTEMQVRLLKRFTNNLRFCFDADAAGFAAAQRGIHLAQSLGADVSVVLIPRDAGKDPDEVVQKDPALWQKIAREPVPIMEYYFEHAVAGKDLMQVEDKRAIGAILLPEIARMQDPIEQEHWLQKLSNTLRVDLDALRGTVKKPTTTSAERRKPESSPGTSKTQQLSNSAVSPKPLRRDLAARLVLGLFIESADLRPRVADRLQPSHFSEGDLRDLYIKACLVYSEPQQPATHSLFEPLRAHLSSQNAGLLSLLSELALMGEQALSATTLNEAREQLEIAIRYLAEAATTDRRRQLLFDIRLAEQAGDAARLETLMQEYRALR